MGYDPRSESEIDELVDDQVDSEIESEIIPVQGAIDQTAADQQAAQEWMERIFGSVMPAIRQSADHVRDQGNRALAAERDIFNQTAAALSGLRSQRAGEAQRLAQQLGVAIPLSMFTDPVGAAQGDMAHVSGTQGLTALGNIQSGVQAAEAFAGKVFPLAQKEAAERTAKDFGARIHELRTEITKIKASKTARKNTRLNDMLIAEREYALKKTQADRDWFISQQGLKSQKEQLALEWANLMGYRVETRKGKRVLVPTLAARDLGEKVRSNKAAEAFNHTELNAEIEIRKAELRYNRDKMNLDVEASAGDLVNSATSGGKATTVVDYQRVPKNEVANYDPGDLIPEDTNGDGTADNWYVKIEKTVTAPPMTNPSQIYDYLVSSGIPKGVALKTVRTRFGLGNKWVPGMADPRDPVTTRPDRGKPRGG